MRKDISTKILSVLFAIVMWFYIIQVQDHEVEKTVNLKEYVEGLFGIEA